MIRGRSRISQRRGTNSPGGGANFRFCQIFLKTAWNQKNLGAQREAHPLQPPKATNDDNDSYDEDEETGHLY